MSLSRLTRLCAYVSVQKLTWVLQFAREYSELAAQQAAVKGSNDTETKVHVPDFSLDLWTPSSQLAPPLSTESLPSLPVQEDVPLGNVKANTDAAEVTAADDQQPSGNVVDPNAGAIDFWTMFLGNFVNPVDGHTIEDVD